MSYNKIIRGLDLRYAVDTDKPMNSDWKLVCDRKIKDS